MQHADDDRRKAGDDDWIRFAAPTSRYNDTFSVPFSMMVLGLVGVFAAIQAMLVDRHFFLPVLGLFPSMATGWAGFLLFRRIRAAGCRIEPDGLRVRNVFSETVVAWDRIERFGLGEAGWEGAALHRTNGTTLSMTGIRAHARDPAAAAIMDRLTAELIRRRRAIQWDWRPGEPVQTPRRPALSAQLRPGFAIALAVVGGICLGPLAIGIAVEAGKDSGGIGAVAACMGLFGAPAIAVIRLRHRKAPLAFTTLVLTYLVIFAMMADGVALALGGIALVVIQSVVATAVLCIAFKVHPPQLPGDGTIR